MKVRPICNHRVLAGFCTIFMLVSLMISGTFFALKGGIFAGENIVELMEANGIDQMFEEFCDDIIDEEFEDEDMEWLVESEYYDDVKSEMSDVFFESFFERQDSVNLDGVVDEIIAAAEAESGNEAPVDFDVQEFEAQMEASFNEMLDEYYGSEAFEGMENVNYYLNMGTTTVTVVAVVMLCMAVLFMVALCFLYRQSIFGAFSKVAIASGVAGAWILCTGLLKYLILFIINEVIGAEMSGLEAEAGMDIMMFLEKLIELMFNPFVLVGVILMIVMVIAIIIWKITKLSFINSSMNNQMNINGQVM